MAGFFLIEEFVAKKLEIVNVRRLPTGEAGSRSEFIHPPMRAPHCGVSKFRSSYFKNIPLMKFLLSINYFYWLILSGVFFAAGEFLSKKFALNPKGILIACILAVYSLGVLAWLPAILQKNQLSIVGAIWSVLSLLTTVLIGLLLFGEKLSVIGIIGIITAVVAVALLSLN